MNIKEVVHFENEIEKKNLRTVVAQACDYCRKRKVKCDGEYPCAVCKSRNLDCTYLIPVRKRGPTKKS
jgi:hypothetical protein